MGDYFIKRTFNTPEIELLTSQGVVKIEGRSIPEDPVEFYEEFIEKIEEYFQNPQATTRFDIRLEYINSGSAKYLLEMLRAVKRHYDKGKECMVNWYYEEDDESIQELGLHYQNTVKIPFNLIEYF
jgi:hypothetical protein